jgi:hypothetical protein
MLTKNIKNIQPEQLTGTDVAKLSLSLQLDQAASHKRSSNWLLLFLILFGLFLLLSYANIRASYKYLFDFFKNSTNKPPFCSVSPSGIMWALAKPWVNQLFITNPLDRNTALFINLAILERKIDEANNGLVMLCGSPCSVVHEGGEPDEATCYDDLMKWTSTLPASPASWEVPLNPLWSILNIPADAPIVNEFKGSSGAKEALRLMSIEAQNNKEIDGKTNTLSLEQQQQRLTTQALLAQYVINPEPLLVLYKRGLAMLALLRNTYAPIDTFAYLWSDAPVNQCPVTPKTFTQQFTSVASTTAVWSMVGTGFTAGSTAGPAGAIVGGLVGIGIGLFQVLTDPGTRTC